MTFRRCLAAQPGGAAVTGAPAVDPFAKNPLLPQKGPTALTVDPSAPKACPNGLIRRAATPDDAVCVSEAVQRRTAQENALAASRAEAGTDRCRQGFVWREATKSDHVCVEPAIRSMDAADNATAR